MVPKKQQDEAQLDSDDVQSPTQGGVKRAKEPRLRGFARVINSQLGSLNSFEKFKQNYANIVMIALLEATDLYPAALVHVTRGQVAVTAIEENDCKTWKKTGALAYLKCTSKQFLEIAAGKLNPAKAWVQRKLKIRGPLKMLAFNQLFKMHLEEVQSKKEKPS
ncbi:MAG TPA: SCP2 sterol-binding domain-containing protein [Candidatus Lokiarchaeia archaeon]|nr:SCP2 sterol-binding domain-containing protein [Candidatus Lokiarchaeia archaeon]